MFGFIFGTACLIGLVKTIKHGRCGGYGYSNCGGGFGGHGWHGHHGGWRGGWGRGMGGGFGGGFGPGRWMLRGLFYRLGTTPGQEKVILEAFEEVQQAGAKLREEMAKAKKDVATSIKGEHFDQETLNDMYKRQDDALAELRKVISQNLAKIHEALDPKQREAVNELLENGFGPGRWGGGFGGGHGRCGGSRWGNRWGGQEVTDAHNV